MIYSGETSEREARETMSRRFGELRQLGYVVRDIEAAMDHWLKVFDVGPWFYVDRLPVGDFRYYGEASDPHVSIAITYSGAAQVELIQQRNDAPSMYRDFIEAGHEGLQHVCYFPENYDEILAKALADGYVVGQGGSSNRGPFVYLATEGHPGTIVELAEYNAVRRQQFDAIKAVGDAWDGTDPIRTVWP